MQLTLVPLDWAEAMTQKDQQGNKLFSCKTVQKRQMQRFTNQKMDGPTYKRVHMWRNLGTCRSIATKLSCPAFLI